MYPRFERPCSRWFLVPRRVAAPAEVLLCLPHAGGSAGAFRDWVGRLPVSVELRAIKLPGRSDRLSEPPIRSVPELVADIGRELSPRETSCLILFGHSMGAIVAFELARWIVQAGWPPPKTLVVSAHRAPHLADPKTIGDLADDALITEVRALGGLPEAVLSHQDLLQIVLPALRSDLQALESWHYEPSPPLPIPILAIGGHADSTVPVDGLMAWRYHTAKRFTTRLFAGGHFYLQEHITDVIEAILSQCKSPVALV